ncbi:hypothetical protein [Domibacillus indicus]|uniref:hypothetical protein n=1 Tax=Domibacillus indicus TaxID=1437523 RepID=UPI00061823F4|nr:hypothetical protein [Domibacillus indicus]
MQLLKKTEKKFYWEVLFFIPLFLTPQGLYQSFVTEDGLHLGDSGLVFPIYFFIGSFLFLYALVLFIREKKILVLSSEVKKVVLFIGIIGFFIASAGAIIYSDINAYVRFFQLITGFVGVSISWYLFEYKKINIEKFFGQLGLMYFGVITINYLYSFTQVGLESFGRALRPSIGLFDIYQTHVYYPFILTTVLYMSLPYILKRYNWFIYPYIGLYFLNLLSWQVRGAIISFLLMLFIAFFVKFKVLQKINIILFLIVFLCIVIYNFGLELVVGRFGNIKGVQSLSGRTDIWKAIFEDFNIVDFLFGDFYRDIDGITAHNQYLELLSLGGILLLFSVLTILFYLSVFLWGNVKKRDRNLLYFGLILFIQWIVDFNVNVPISNTNPAIFTWFYLNSIFVLLNTSRSEFLESSKKIFKAL